MTIRTLEIFLEVAKTGSMSLAAKSLYLSQPTFSHAISSLESEYNTQLFDRTPHRLYLTQTGRTLVAEAVHVLQAIQHLEESMQSPETNTSINIGASVTVAASILDSLLDAFHEKYPQMKTKLFVSNTAAVEEAMENNEVDLAIVSGEIHNAMMETKKIIEDYQVCVCRSDHPFAKKKEVSLEELSRENFVMLLSTRWTRIAFENYVRDKGYSLNIVCECSNTGLVKEQVLKGHGITVISARVVEKELLSGKLSLIRCEGCYWKRPFILAYRKQKYLSKPLKDFIELAENYRDNAVLQLLGEKGELG